MKQVEQIKLTKAEELAGLERRASDIEMILAPWKGMTFSEARQRGFDDSLEALQVELWNLGRSIIELKIQ